MFPFDVLRKKERKPTVLHFVTWFPSSEEDIHGIFIRRHIELLKKDSHLEHLVVKKSKARVSAYRHLLSLFGFFTTRKVGQLQVLQIVDESFLYNKFFWRHKSSFEHKQLQKLVEKYKPVFCHLHVVYGFGEEAVYIKKRWGIPFMVTEHMGRFPFDWLYNKQKVVVEPIKEASFVTAVGRTQAEQIEEYTGVKPAIVYNIVDPADFFYAEFKKSKTLQLVSVGIYDSRKGFDYLVKVFPEFLMHHPGSKLHLVGQASETRMQELQKLVTTGNIENHVQFHGRLGADQLRQLYQACDFYVCGSEGESFGVSVLEALFTGLPVLATDCGGVNEFMSPGNGIIVTNDRKEETLLKGLLDMVTRLESFDRASISKQVMIRFSGAHIRDQFESLYKQIQEQQPI